MKKSTLTLWLTLFCYIANAQTEFYYFRGQQIPLTVDRSRVHIIINDEGNESQDLLFQNFGVEVDNSRQTQGMAKLKFQFEPTIQEYSEIVSFLRQSQEIRHVFPFFERVGAEPIGTSDIFYVRLKEIKDSTILKKVAERHNAEIIRQIPYMPEWYVLSILNSTFSNSIEASNYFFETGYFQAVDPAFMFNFRPSCANDADFSQQWGLQNTTNLLARMSSSVPM